MLSFIILLFVLSSLLRGSLFRRSWRFFGGWHPMMRGPFMGGPWMRIRFMGGPWMGGPFGMHGPFMGGPFGMHGHPRGPWMGGHGRF